VLLQAYHVPPPILTLLIDLLHTGATRLGIGTYIYWQLGVSQAPRGCSMLRILELQIAHTWSGWKLDTPVRLLSSWKELLPGLPPPMLLHRRPHSRLRPVSEQGEAWVSHMLTKVLTTCRVWEAHCVQCYLPNTENGDVRKLICCVLLVRRRAGPEQVQMGPGGCCSDAYTTQEPA
jgi:hypothetical protein